MTTLCPHQSDRGRCVRQTTNTNALHIHVTNCAAKLHGHCHEARKIVCDNFQRAARERVMELLLYAKQALPLVWTRILRLAQISPMAARSPARQPRDGRETSGKTAGGISRRESASCPGKGWAATTATPPNVHQDGSQDNSHCTGNGRAMATPEIYGTTRNAVTQPPRHNRATVGVTARKTTRSNLNHNTQKL